MRLRALKRQPRIPTARGSAARSSWGRPPEPLLVHALLGDARVQHIQALLGYYKHIYMYIYIYMSLSLSIYIYMSIYIIYIYTYIYIYIKLSITNYYMILYHIISYHIIWASAAVPPAEIRVPFARPLVKILLFGGAKAPKTRVPSRIPAPGIFSVGKLLAESFGLWAARPGALLRDLCRASAA